MHIRRQGLQAGYGCEDVTPRGFVSLMDLYELNYIRLRKLIPDLPRAGLCPQQAANGQRLRLCAPYGRSRIAGCLDLHCEILEQTRYTTTLLLTYYFVQGEGAQARIEAEPQIRCRVYHDAALVEVLTGHLLHGRQRYDNLPARAVKVKWRLNRLLFKWLGFSLRLGHSFRQFSETQPALVTPGQPAMQGVTVESS